MHAAFRIGEPEGHHPVRIQLSLDRGPRPVVVFKDSWKKKDKYDPRNMVKTLWVHLVTGEFGIPSVYKPSGLTRELRKLFSQCESLNRQIRMLKNNIQAILLENGIVISSRDVLHSSPYPRPFYCELTEKRGRVRSCIALIRKVCSIMRRMLLSGEEFRWIERGLFERKLKAYNRTLEEMREERKSA